MSDKIVEKKKHTAYISALWAFFLIVTLFGSMVDMFMIGDALNQVEMEAIFGLSQNVFVMFISFSICLLSVVFMFKAGSLTHEGRKRPVRLFVLAWGGVGVTLIGLRCIASMLGAVHKANQCISTGISDSCGSPNLFNNPPSPVDILMAVMLFLLYIGTGISAYQLGVNLGNPNLNDYHKLRKLLKRDQKILEKGLRSMQRSYTKCLSSQSEIERYKSQLYSLYNNSILRKRVLINDAIVKPLREAGIVVNQEIIDNSLERNDYKIGGVK
ncbi:MAG: hypothetical protein LBM13_05745 [Candidatus Ancillula sp.]|jgi:hypothetical protein|nr:hypothetical protein [Candidatus Ancillula sp.]